MAAQLTAWNISVVRGLWLWMARAISSLPVPDSPRMSTVEFERATLRIIFLTASISGEAEMISWSSASRRASARRMVSSSVSWSKGFSR